MKRNRICTGQWFVAVLFLAIGLSTYGCSDSVSVLENVEVPLSSLTVTPGSLRPAFFSNTTSYTVNAPTSADSVTVTATPKDSTTTMTINGIPTATGQGRSVLLGPPGSITSITIVLESLNGTESTYTVNVTRLLSSDNNLSALDVTPGNLNPPFDPDIEDYTANVGVLVDSVTVSATKSDPNASMRIGSVTVPPGTASGQATISLGAPGTPTPVSIEVTAPNGSKKSYAITVNRLSDDNNLSALTVTPGALSPAFASNTLNYTADVGTGVTAVTVVATKSNPNAVLSGSIADPGAGQATGQATIPLGGPGTATPVTITVTAPNGNSKTYNITVNRAASSDNNLSALTVTSGALSPPFASNTLDYIVNVATDVTEVTVTATKSDPNAVLSGSIADPGAGQATGQATIPLGGPGTATPVTITVTAPNGNSKTYNITVNRAASSDNNLSALTVTSGALSPPFASNTLDYIVNVATDVTEVTVTATKSDPNAVLSGSIADPGAGQATGQATIPLGGPGTATPVSITVTAPSGAFKTYSITVNRLSSDNNLSALTVTPGSLFPDFASSTTTYTVDVPFSVDSVTVSATKADPNAVMSGDVTAGTGVATGEATFSLVPLFPRTVSITVTATNGESKTYAITITRALF